MRLFQHIETTPEKILETTFRLLAENGYANISMRTIASEAGVAVSQLTYHYKTKEKLIAAVVGQVVVRSIKNAEACATAFTSPRDRLLAVAEYFSRLLSVNKDMLKIAIDFTAQSLWVESFREQINDMYTSISAVIQSNIFGGDAFAIDASGRKISADSAARLVIGALFGTAVQTVLGLDKNIADEALAYGKQLLENSTIF